MIDLDAARQRWHPIAASDDLPHRHVFQAQLLGRELALWRADDGNVNAWENRCLHRGVRLSIGINDGSELVCQYHGWRYANRTAGCTYIPAHPADSPARTICNNTYPVKELQGLVWCCEMSGHGPMPTSEQQARSENDNQRNTPLYAISIDAPLEQTADGLMDRLSVALAGQEIFGSVAIERIDTFTLNATRITKDIEGLTFYLQPADAGRTIVRGVMNADSDVSGIVMLQWLKHVSNALNQCRRHIERVSSTRPVPTHWQPTIKPVSENMSSLPEISSAGRQTGLRVQVTRIDDVAFDIKNFRLESINEQLPGAQPGAHIDVHLPNGLIRQYSLINGPGQTDHYSIAIKKTVDSSGGSEALHTRVKAGNVLAVSAPRNNFSLRRDAQHTHLIAGGIGITPLLSMARALNHSALPFSLHYFVTSEHDIVFRPELEALSGTVQFHVGLTANKTQKTLNHILAKPDPLHHVYLCGPAGMMSVTRQCAATHGWPETHIHYEYFKNTTDRHTTTPFTVELARSGLTLSVPDGKTLLQVLRENTVAVPSSCEQGACGTCRVSVLDGIPDHQDVYLNDTERKRGDCLMSCVSRAKSNTLVLDL